MIRTILNHCGALAEILSKFIASPPPSLPMIALFELGFTLDQLVQSPAALPIHQ